MNLEFQKEVEEWEVSLLSQACKRMYKTTKKYRDPRLKVLRDYRRHNKYRFRIYNHERKPARKMTNRKFRRKLRRELYNEVYYKVVPHDYKTYGWITW